MVKENPETKTQPGALSGEEWAAVNRLRLAAAYVRRKWYHPDKSLNGDGFCMMVALHFAGVAPDFEEQDPARHALEKVCRERLAAMPAASPGPNSIIAYNDHPETTMADVLSAMVDAEALIGR